MRVSLRYCPLSNRLRSPLVMLTAPVPDGGYTRTLVQTRSANLFVVMLPNHSQLVEVLRWLGLSRFLRCSSREHPAYAVHSASPGQASNRDRTSMHIYRSCGAEPDAVSSLRLGFAFLVFSPVLRAAAISTVAQHPLDAGPLYMLSMAIQMQPHEPFTSSPRSSRSDS